MFRGSSLNSLNRFAQSFQIWRPLLSWGMGNSFIEINESFINDFLSIPSFLFANSLICSLLCFLKDSLLPMNTETKSSLEKYLVVGEKGLLLTSWMFNKYRFTTYLTILFVIYYFMRKKNHLILPHIIYSYLLSRI